MSENLSREDLVKFLLVVQLSGRLFELESISKLGLEIRLGLIGVGVGVGVGVDVGVGVGEGVNVGVGEFVGVGVGVFVGVGMEQSTVVC